MVHLIHTRLQCLIFLSIDHFPKASLKHHNDYLDKAFLEELVRLGCLLRIMMPYGQASEVLRQWSGLSLSAASLWNWVQQVGQRAETALAEDLEVQSGGEGVAPEPMDVDTAPLVVWLSDGGRGFWRVYRTCFATAIAVLDFFPAAGHLARATEALFGSLYSAEARAWFHRWRHWLRHGQARRVRQTLLHLIHLPGWSASAFATLRLDEEVREIDEDLTRAKQRDRFELVQRWAVRPRDIQGAILELCPQIVHFSGHGVGETFRSQFFRESQSTSARDPS
ncbi:MAG: hypothetical protein ACOYMP_07030 [Nodosilinea sp.]